MRTEHPRRPNVAVIIVSYNTADLLLDCVASVMPQLIDGDALVVFDNASVDGSADLIEQNHASVTVVRSQRNLGFAAACNAAAASADQPYVLLLNPDGVAHDGLIDALTSCALRRPRAGLYGGRTVARDGKVDPRSCWGAPTLWSTFCFAVGLTTAFRRNPVLDPESLGRWQRDTERHVDVVSGCLLMVDRELWNRLGGFDERFFMYGEDLDLCLRAKAMGASPVVTPDAVLTHDVGASSSRADKLCLLFAGKLTALQRHLGSRYPIANALLRAGIAARALLALASGGRVASVWLIVWRRRSEWAHGFPIR